MTDPRPPIDESASTFTVPDSEEVASDPEASAQWADAPPGDEVAAPLASPAWVRWVTTAGLALVVITVIDTLSIVAQGLSLGARIGAIYRIGFAFGTPFNKDALGWIGLLLAIILVNLPSFVGAATTPRQDRAAALTIALATAFAVVIAVGAVLGMSANVRLYHLVGRPLGSSVKRELAMFTFRHVAASALVLFAGLASLKTRFTHLRQAHPLP